MKKLIAVLMLICLMSAAVCAEENTLIAVNELRTAESIVLTEDYAACPVKRICIVKASANHNPTVLVDFEAGMAYYDKYDFLDDPSQARYQLALDEEVLKTINDLLLTIHPWYWQSLYDFSDSEQDQTERSYWEANIQYEDGVARFIQIGMPRGEEEGRPYEAEYFSKMLMKLVWSSAE